MKQIIKLKDRVGPALEKHFHRHGVRASHKEQYKGFTIYLAEGGPHFDASPRIIGKGDEWMLSGYYLSVWAVQRGLAILGRPAYFALGHDLSMTDEARRRGRLEAACADAKGHIDDMLRAGLLKDEHKVA